MKVLSKPSSVWKMIGNLSPQQKEDVEAIGFGGLLEINMESNVTDMYPWLVDKFIPNGQMLRISDGKEIVVTAEDVADVLQLPRNEAKPVEEYNIVRSGYDEFDAVNKEWHER